MYDEYYRSKLVKEDIFASYSNKDKSTESTEHIEVLCSIGHRRDENAPGDLTRKEKDELHRSAEVQELNMRIKEATAKMPPNPDKGSAQFKERQKLYTEKSMLYRSARASRREKWFSGSFDEEAQRQLEQEDDETLPKPRGRFPLIRHLMPERDRIANTLFVTKGLQSKAGQAVLQDVYSLCNDDNRVAYRPNERPVDGACPSNNCLKVIAE